MLTEHDIVETVRAVGLQGAVTASLIKTHNHVYRIQTGENTFFLKTYSKDWYSSDPAQTGGCVAHEACAWRVMAAHGLSTPRVVEADMTCANPLGRPFILTEALRGGALPDQLAKVDRADFHNLLHAVGLYLRRMHAIRFRFPGYIMRDEGPQSPPDPDGWQHNIWTFERFWKDAQQRWQIQATRCGAQLAEEVRGFASQNKAEVESAFEPPRFIHGDCHAHQFFLYRADTGWAVSGVVDMEVASAGCPETDFYKFFCEMTERFPTSSGWWEPLFEGYGREPSIVALRVFMMTWETRPLALAQILKANDWARLLDTMCSTEGEKPDWH